MCSIWSGGSSRNRVNRTIRSAESSCSSPGMLVWWSGSTIPVSGSIGKSTVQVKPWRTARIFPSIGSASSERYSSSPLTRTMWVPSPGPEEPS